MREGAGVDSIWQHVNQQIYLGDDAFVARAQKRASLRPDDLNIPRSQRRPPAPPLKEIADAHSNRDEAMCAAWATGEYSYVQIAGHFGLHFTTVGRVVRRRSARG